MIKHIVFSILMFIFSLNVYSEVPNEVITKNPKKEVTTIKSEKNRNHANMSITVNKINIKEVKGQILKNGSVQYFIPKDENNITTDKSSQYVVFENKEHLYKYLNNKNKTLKSLVKPINSRILQHKKYDLLTVDSNKNIYIAKIGESAKIFKGVLEPRKILNYFTDSIHWTDEQTDQAIIENSSLIWTNDSITKVLIEHQGATNQDIFSNIQLNNDFSWGMDLYFTGSFSTSMGNDFIIVDPRGHETKVQYRQSPDRTFVTFCRGIEGIGNISLAKGEAYFHMKVDTTGNGADTGIVRRDSFKTAYYGNYGPTYKNHTVTLGYFKDMGTKEITISDIELNTEQNIGLLPGITRFNEFGYIRITEKGVQVTQNGLYEKRDNNGNHFIFGFKKQTPRGGFAQPYIRFLDYRKPTKVSFIVESFYKDSTMSHSDPGKIINRQVVNINITAKPLEAKPLTLDLTKAIPNKEYIIELNTGLGSTAEYIRNPLLDQNIHQINLFNTLNLSGIDKIELRIDGKDYTQSSYEGISYNAKLQNKNLVVVRKDNDNMSIPEIELKLYKADSLKSIYRIKIINPKATSSKISYNAEIDRRFYRALEETNIDGKLYYNGYINNIDYSKLFNKTSSNPYSIQSIASINNSYDIKYSYPILYNEYGFYKNKTPLEGYKDLKQIKPTYKTNDTLNMLYLGNDNKYQDIDLTLIDNSKITKDKIYSGTGQLDITSMPKNEKYIFTKNQLTIDILELKNVGEFITTGTAFNENSDIVDNIIVTDLDTKEIKKINGKSYNDREIEITLGQNNLSLQKLIDNPKSKNLQIDYYYQDLKIGTYILNLKNEIPIKIEGIDSFDFGDLLPGKSETLQTGFSLKGINTNLTSIKFPPNSIMRYEKGKEIISEIPLEISGLYYKYTNNELRGQMKVTANPPQNAQPGQYSGTIDLVVTIE